jgi:hypothetical protein
MQFPFSPPPAAEAASLIEKEAQEFTAEFAENAEKKK